MSNALVINPAPHFRMPAIMNSADLKHHFMPTFLSSSFTPKLISSPRHFKQITLRPPHHHSTSIYMRASKSSRNFDYIIVGGGAAGCVLANRLTEDHSCRVLLLESGKRDTKPYIHIPLGFPYLLGSDVDWAFTSEPEAHLNGRRLYFPRGKVLGGSHAISVMLYHRGDRADYERWQQLGAKEWGPADVLPYFIKSEGHTGKKLRPGVHGVEGPLSVSDLVCMNPMSKAFLNASNDQGIENNPDFNDWSRPQTGVGPFQVTQRNGQRTTPSTSYLEKAKGRKNLTVEVGASVERVQISQVDAKPTATGVEFVDSEGSCHTVNADKEVVLAGGVFASPQLLMLSGIGPGNHLKEMGIRVMVDNPNVGLNLQDHPAVMTSYFSRDPQGDKRKSSTYYTEQTGRNPLTLFKYFFMGRGPLTSPMCEAGGFVKTRPGLQSADLQLRFIPFFSEPDPYESLSEFSTRGDYLRNQANRPAGFTLQSVLARPKSRGSVKLQTLDVRDAMRIHGNWMAEDEDIQTLVEGIKLCRNIAKQEPFAEYRGEERYPGPDISTDKDLEQYVKDTCHTANALVGTCRMGTFDAVVDNELRVKGVDRLRVIDSSVMPTLPGGQSGSPTMMIAEKGADLLKASAAKEAEKVQVLS